MMSQITSTSSNGFGIGGRWGVGSIRHSKFLSQNGECCYCEKPMQYPTPRQKMKDAPANVATTEHLRERCNGGDDSEDNLALACTKCNNGRRNRHWAIWKSMCLRETIDPWAVKFINPNYRGDYRS